MRFPFLFACLSVALVLCRAPAHAIDAKAWRTELQGLGNAKFVCIAPTCGVSSALSYKAQLLFIYTLLDYESKWRSREINSRNVAQAISKVGLFRRMDSYDETEGDLRHYTVVMRHREPNGVVDYVVAGYIARGVQAYEMLSMATTKEQAETNYRFVVDEVSRKFRSP